MENLDQIKKLRQNANEIYALFNNRIPIWESDKKHYDKTGWGFNLDDRFKACESINIYFSSWKGVYGDSGCSTQLSLDKKTFGTHLLKYLNKNKKEIMLAVAAQIEDEARTIKDKAEAELAQQMEYLKELDTP